MDSILPIPRREIERQTAANNTREAVVFQKDIFTTLEELEGNYDAETIRTRCCVDVDEDTGEINGLDLSGLEVGNLKRPVFCIGKRVPIAELTAEQWIRMRVDAPATPKRRTRPWCCGLG